MHRAAQECRLDVEPILFVASMFSRVAFPIRNEFPISANQVACLLS
jgi:hypothetical protein